MFGTQKEKPQQACGCPLFSLLRRLAGLLVGVLVLGYALADPVLLTIDPSLLGLREMAVVLCHVFLFTVLHTGLALLEVGRLLRVQLPALDAVANALLLVFFTAVHLIDARMAGIDNARARTRGV
jgi:hypothetical protein